jgi:hypothetical protein
MLFVAQGKNKTMISSGALVILWCFGGLKPNYRNITGRLSVFGAVLNCISPFNLSMEAQVNTSMAIANFAYFHV